MNFRALQNLYASTRKNKFSQITVRSTSKITIDKIQKIRKNDFAGPNLKNDYVPENLNNVHFSQRFRQ